MSSTSDNYLRSLSIKPNPFGHQAFTSKKNNLKETDQDAVEIDTILLNIYKVDNIFFNKKSKTIMLRLKDEMKDIFYYDSNSNLMKLANHTKIASNAFKNFIVYPMQLDTDAILYKDEST